MRILVSRFCFLSCLSFFGSMAQAAFVFIGGERPASVKLPATYDPAQSYPLMVLLHGYGSDASETVNYLEADLHQAASSFVYLAPEGTPDAQGRLHWNATPPQKPGAVNDSAYIQDLIAEVRARFSIDAKRIYVMGISNGGFMAYRLACDTDGLFAGIVSIAGAMFADTTLCKSKTPLSILQIHGSADKIVPFVSQRPSTLGALASVEVWAKRNACQNLAEFPASRDIMLQPEIPGIVLADGAYQTPAAPVIINDQGAKETDETVWSDCVAGVKTGLWRVNGGTHVPDYSGKNLISQALEFFSGK